MRPTHSDSIIIAGSKGRRRIRHDARDATVSVPLSAMTDEALSTVQVHLHRDNGVATLTLDDTRRRNAMSLALGDALEDQVKALSRESTLRAVVLTGAGGAFSSGGDLTMLEALRGTDFEHARTQMLGFYRRFLSVLTLPVPLIAAVRGPAIGAGLCLALACDIVLVDHDAPLALTFARLGLAPGMGVSMLVERHIGPQRTAELLYTARRINGREAVSMGLALSSHPAEKVLTEAQSLARCIANNSPLAVRALKARLALDQDTVTRALELEATAQAHSFATKDLGEGLSAQRSKRPPHFTEQ